MGRRDDLPPRAAPDTAYAPAPKGAGAYGGAVLGTGYFTIVMRSAFGGASGDAFDEWAVR